jgi:hypothetical protein
MDELTQKLRQEFADKPDRWFQGAVDDLREMRYPPPIRWPALLAIADECERRERSA